MSFLELIKKPKKLGIAFGGGATRGFAHIGVVKALEEAGLEFDYVSGNSAGSFVGALYSYGMSWKDMYGFAKTLRYRDIMSKNLGLGYKSENIENIVEKAIGDITFKELKIPFSAISVDVKTANQVILNSGKVSRAVRCSCCIPGVFTPVKYNDMVLVDGGTLNSIPSDVVRKMGADFVVGIDLNSDRKNGTESEKYIDILFSAINIMMSVNADKGKQNSDLVIAPQLKGYKHYKLNNIEKLIELGEEATIKALPEIKKVINKKTKSA